METTGHYKDLILDQLAVRGNVAQFVSFDPDLSQRFAWILGSEPNFPFPSAERAVAELLQRSTQSSANIRTFHPLQPKSREFVYGLTTVASVMDRLRGFAGAGLHTIVNETVDIHDGGVSGVAFGDLIEFAPDDTPRCVEKPGTAAFSRALAVAVFKTVYGFDVDLPADPSLRVEFSIHPLRRGYHASHTILWEIEQDVGPMPGVPVIVWPNRFSRFIGDKAFGLLVAWLSGFRVPFTLAIPRRVAPFSFGDGGTLEPWIRTAPAEQVPGRFTTQRGWLDPFALMIREDPSGTAIASVLYQHGIDAVAAGAAATQADGTRVIEGVRGFGDAFMVGERAPETLPPVLLARVTEVHSRLERALGAARCEWVDDGDAIWIVQLHHGASVSVGRTIVPGTPSRYHRFDVARGLEELRALVETLRASDEGIALVGEVGVTSHFGDVLRRARIPSRLETP